jgi:ribosomal protein S18 acetylase RimI-like enzyme
MIDNQSQKLLSIAPAGYTWRPARREDAIELNRLLLDIESIDQREWVDTVDDRLRDFEDPGIRVETDTLLAITSEGRIAASAWVFSPSEADQEYVAFLWGEIHPAHRQRGLGKFILNWMEQRGREILNTRPADLPHYLKIQARENLMDRVQLIRSHDFEPVRSFYRMRRDLSEPFPDWSIPKQITLTKWSLERNQEALQVVNEAFRDHWGFVPANEEIWRLFLVGHPAFKPELSFMAIARTEAKERKLIGLSLNRVHEEENALFNRQEGWIAELAVLKPWRNQGIATALLYASMQAFREAGLDYAGLGVDTENYSGALRIYERAGFVPVNRGIAFVKYV